MSRRPLHLLPRRILGRVLHALARVCPGATTLRPWLHRLRGVKIGAKVFIGDQVFIDNEYPERIEIEDHAQISIRTILLAHTRGAGRIVIERNVFIGPNSVLTCSGGRVLRIGEGAVVGAGAVITKSVPPHLFVGAPAPQAIARVNVPLPVAQTMEDFRAGLDLIERPDPEPSERLWEE
jgi:serine acetyltransferase